VQESIDQQLAQDIVNYHEGIFLAIAAPPTVILVTHFALSLYRIFTCKGWSRRLSILSFQFLIFGVLFLFLKFMVGVLLLFSAVVAQVSSGFVVGVKSRVPDILYVGVLLMAGISYFLIVGIMGNT